MADTTARGSDIIVTCIIEMGPCTVDNGVENKPF